VHGSKRNETIVDGRNRYLACDKALVDPRFDTLPIRYVGLFFPFHGEKIADVT
jgi:hypothetical protein